MDLKRERGIALYVAVVAAAVTLVASLAAAKWDSHRLASADKAGYDRAMAEVKGAQLLADNMTLIRQRDQIITLTTDLSKAQDELATSKQNLADARLRAERNGERVRVAAAPGGDLEGRIAAADLNGVRAFGAGAFRTATTCRGYVAELGLGAGGLVEVSASEHYQAKRADALMQFSMPKSPFKNKE